ncbi:SIMPL domain-containing protein [Myxococcota bacterium]|nr:SIMPL domain-containing protein [Myxococcota bacterium]MBU1535314.1 SIMPL domain-containing protein [Myxococcota bacterium]
MKVQPKSFISLVSYFIIGVAVIVSTVVAASAWKSVKNRPKERTIKVTGSAKRRIVSDRIGWTATMTVTNMDRTTAYKELSANVVKALDYLKSKGIKEKQISVSAATFHEKHETEYHGTGTERVEKSVFKGYTTRQTITVESSEVLKVEKISREITSLLEQGIAIYSSAPRYYYTKIGELKITMLAEASGDARNRAQNIVSKADNTSLGRLKKATMGIININPANSTSVAWDGNNDVTSLEKDIITIVHAEYFLD